MQRALLLQDVRPQLGQRLARRRLLQQRFHRLTSLFTAHVVSHTGLTFLFQINSFGLMLIRHTRAHTFVFTNWFSLTIADYDSQT